MAMSGPKRNPDRLNTIGIVVVGICGAVLVYVTIVALEAFYVNDTSEIQTMADYGGQDTNARSLRAEQTNRIGEYGTNARPAAPKAGEAAKPQTYRIPIDVAMKLVADGAKTDPAGLIPSQGRSEKSTVLPIFGRPKLIPAPAAPPAAAAAAGSAAAPAGAGSGSAGAGSAGAAVTLPSAPQVPTGAGSGPSPVGGAGPLDKSATPGTPGNPTGPVPDKAMKGATAAGTATTAGSNARPAPKTEPTAGARTVPAPKAGTAPKAGSAATPPKGNGK
jgi:hypothetical protein